ncbi:hypothetical protein [Flavobacterium tistrianum]|uniref:hypothetical protein n=1 Tax=Flavobacterium tistrianum TaxID=1685414 RepID=UPI000DAB940E|nr:hypothetical protein [Flavobacterium tistrianum]KAF2342601.1 hypothetical protein DMB71_02815 [Flavobacterium tistrianum]
MNLDKKENYSPEDQYFQDDETRYENDHQYDDIDIDAPPADHSISDNAEPDYGDEFDEDQINNQKLDDNPGGDEFDEEFEDDENDEDIDDGDELNQKDFEEDESGTDPNRNI